MRRLSIIAALALFAAGSAGTASAQVQNCRQGNGPLGTVVGAVVGGAAGGAIANNTRGFRGGRGFNRGGFRGGRGFRRGRGNQGLGVVLGALAGGIAGNQIANARTRNCNNIIQSQRYSQRISPNGQVLNGGPIDYNARRLGDPYGGQRVINGQVVQQQRVQQVAPPIQQHGQQQGHQQGVFQPVCQNVSRTTRLPNGRVLNEPVEFCQFSPGGEWVQR